MTGWGANLGDKDKIIYQTETKNNFNIILNVAKATF